jgi:hypothetical protein
VWSVHPLLKGLPLGKNSLVVLMFELKVLPLSAVVLVLPQDQSSTRTDLLVLPTIDLVVLPVVGHRPRDHWLFRPPFLDVA